MSLYTKLALFRFRRRVLPPIEYRRNRHTTGPMDRSTFSLTLLSVEHFAPSPRPTPLHRPHLRSPALTPVDLAATAAAFAAFNHYDPPLLRELCARVAQLARVPDPTATPPTPPAAARAGGARGRHRSNDGGHGDGGGDGARRGEKKGGDSGGGGGLPPRVLIHVLWCCAVLSHVDEGMLGALYGRLAGMDLSGLSVPGGQQCVLRYHAALRLGAKVYWQRLPTIVSPQWTCLHDGIDWGPGSLVSR